jgi:DNA repair and recombination protein RAD52
MASSIRGEATSTRDEVASKLWCLLGPEFVSTRPGRGGKKFHYLQGRHLRQIMNGVFAFDGWSYHIVDRKIEYCSEDNSGTWSAVCTVVARIALARYGHCSKEEVGCGDSIRQQTRADAISMAMKAASTDAFKRACRMFGEVTGNCLFSEDYLRWVLKVSSPAEAFSEDRLYRVGDKPPPYRSRVPMVFREKRQRLDKVTSTKSHGFDSDSDVDFDGIDEDVFENVD